jgi:hypothetical protein
MLASYVLTALIHKPKTVYLISWLHNDANTSLVDLLWEKRPLRGIQAYSETKFHDLLLAFAVARLFMAPHIVEFDRARLGRHQNERAGNDERFE